MEEIQTIQQWKKTDRYTNLMNNYNQYMRSDKWKDKKNELIGIFGNICEACGSKKDIQCHHGSYSKVGNEPLHHIFLLCDSCHIEYHTNYYQFGVSIEQTEIFISRKRGLSGMIEYSKIRRKLLQSTGAKVPKSNF